MNDVPVVELMYLVFTRMSGETCCRRLRSLLLCLCDAFPALINSLACCVTPSCVWRGTGGNWHSRIGVGGGGRGGQYPSLRCRHQKTVSDESHFNVSLIARNKVTRQCPQTTTFWRERRAEAESNRGPSAYQPNALPLSQTGSSHCRGQRVVLSQSALGGKSCIGNLTNSTTRSQTAANENSPLFLPLMSQRTGSVRL